MTEELKKELLNRISNEFSSKLEENETSYGKLAKTIVDIAAKVSVVAIEEYEKLKAD